MSRPLFNGVIGDSSLETCPTSLLRRCVLCACAMVRGSPNPLHFGLPKRLRLARKAGSRTKLSVTQDAGVGQAAAHDIEAGQRIPTVATVARLASALGVAAGWLAYGLGEQVISGAASTTDGMGARLSAIRTERGETKAALARAVGLSPSTVADIENGAQTGVDVLEALAKVLAVSPAWLAFGEGPMELPSRRRKAEAATQGPDHG